MLSLEDREQLQATARHALDFIFDHCNDTQFCVATGWLVNGMRELCDEEQREFHGPSSTLAGPPSPTYPSMNPQPMVDRTQAEQILRSVVAQELHTQRQTNGAYAGEQNGGTTAP